MFCFHKTSRCVNAQLNIGVRRHGKVMLTITVRYQLDGKNWQERQLSPEEYFWVDPDESGEPFKPTSVTNFDDASDLVPDSERQRVTALVTDILDSTTNESFKCAHSYYRGTESYVCLTTHTNGGKVSRELIVTGEVPFRPEGNQVIRIAIEGDTAALNMNWVGWGKGGDEFGYNIKDGNGDA